MIGAKKFTRNTCCQTSSVVSIEDEPLAAFGLGRDRRIVDQRVQLAVLEPLLDLGDGCDGVCRDRRGRPGCGPRAPSPTGSSPGTRWREQVMTRQPAAEKRFTVACPMPRLAPVSSSVRRGWFACGVGMIQSQIRFNALHGNPTLDMICAACAGIVQLTDRAASCSTARPARSRRNSMRSCSRNGRSCQNSIASGTIR